MHYTYSFNLPSSKFQIFQMFTLLNNPGFGTFISSHADFIRYFIGMHFINVCFNNSMVHLAHKFNSLYWLVFYVFSGQKYSNILAKISINCNAKNFWWLNNICTSEILNTHIIHIFFDYTTSIEYSLPAQTNTNRYCVPKNSFKCEFSRFLMTKINNNFSLVFKG